MKIKMNSAIVFDNVLPGNVFLIGDVYYIKTNTIISENTPFNSVRLDNGSFNYVDENFIVTICNNAKLVVDT